MEELTTGCWGYHATMEPQIPCPAMFSERIHILGLGKAI